MPKTKVRQWLDTKAKNFRDAVDELKALVEQLGKANQPVPIPVRVDDRPRRNSRR